LPVAAGAAAWLGGTLVVHELPSLPGASVYVPLGLAALLLLWRAEWRFLLCAIAGFSWTAHCASERLAERLPAVDLGRDFALTGWIDGFPTPAPGQVTFSLAVAAPRPAAVPARVRLTWYDPPADVAAGANVAVVARLKPPRGLRNPGGFDYERWLLLAGYGATGYVRSGAVEPAATHDFGIAQDWLRYRARIAERLGAAAPGADAAALLTALSIGERFRFTEQHWNDFRVTGTSHLVAVSGLHVALIGVCVFAVLRRLWLYLPIPIAQFDLEAAALASAAATVWYAALTGFAVPAQRSFLMIVVALAVLASRRHVAPFNAVALALVLVLIADPFAPLAASFWLSFGAVALLILIGAPRHPAAAAQRRARRLVRSAVALTRLQWGISFGLLPLTVVFFAECSLIGPFANLLAIPLFNLVLVPLTLLATLVIEADPLGPALVHAAGVLASYTVHVLHVLAEWPWAAVQVPQPDPWTIAIAACGVWFAVAAPPLPGRKLAWLALLPLFVPLANRIPEGDARAVVLDVGHGLAVLVETRNYRLLYDAGPRYPSGFDLGDEVALPAIARGGPAGLDALIVSHADNDHSGGAPAVLRAFPRADVLHGPDVTGLAAARACSAGQQWTRDGVQFSILHPRASFGARGNDSSCVLRVATRQYSMLVTGDIEALGERALLEGAPVAADVVVVPHHGSATSSSERLVAGARAEWALVSAGHANRWSFPRSEVRKRWEGAGARVLVTGDAGALTVRSTAAGAAVYTERGRRRRYWDPE
jgi:competence protein ComEC